MTSFFNGAQKKIFRRMPKHIMRVDKDEKEPQVLSNMRVRYSHISAVILVC